VELVVLMDKATFLNIILKKLASGPDTKTEARPLTSKEKKIKKSPENKSFQKKSDKTFPSKDFQTDKNPETAKGNDRKGFDWDDDQRLVIECSASEKLLVEAGPGTGKTQVACARVARLIELGVSPPNIWMISFTRTAVKEIRDRISEFLGNRRLAGAVQVSTLDSKSWRIVAGLGEDEGGALFENYETTIEKAIKLIEEEEDSILDYIEDIQHLIIDESQDVTGVRTDFILALIERMKNDSGVTVFADPHQAIYGFTRDDDDCDNGANHLADAIIRNTDLGFSMIQLKNNYRVKNEKLKSLNFDLREIISSEKIDGKTKIAKMRQKLPETIIASKMSPGVFRERDDLLIQFRTRGEALMFSSMASNESVSHRLRLSGMPNLVYPWIGFMFCDLMTDEISEGDFARLWARKIDKEMPHLASGMSSTEAWETIFAISGAKKGRVTLARLRNLLSRTSPPVEACIADHGTKGPVIGTTHASKGREAEEVLLFLSHSNKGGEVSEDSLQEEARVIYVGATRPRKGLKVGKGYWFRTMKIDSGRACKKTRKGFGAQVETGRNGDIDTNRQVSESSFRAASAVHRSQRILAELASQTPLPLIARSPGAGDWTYRLYSRNNEGESLLGFLSEAYNNDLFRVSDRCFPGKKMRPPNEINYIHLAGVSTCAVPDESPLLEKLHSPYSKSGFFLVPVITGLPPVYFKWSRK